MPNKPDEVVIVGWIDPAGVIVPPRPAGWPSSVFPDDGYFGGLFGFYRRAVTAEYLWSEFLKPAARDRCPRHPKRPRELDQNEREFILHWMFKFSGNFYRPGCEPPQGRWPWREFIMFRDNLRNFKLLNHLVVEWTSATELKRTARDSYYLIGRTQLPFFKLKSKSGEHGFHNGQFWRNGNDYWQINDGTPDRLGRVILNRLVAHCDFANIWSVIMHVVDPPETATALWSRSAYPTFYVYVRNSDGDLEFRERLAQAASPHGNFLGTPYPANFQRFATGQILK